MSNLQQGPTGRWWRELAAATVLLALAGCGGSSVEVGVPPDLTGPEIAGQVFMPNGEVAALPSMLERIAAAASGRVDALDAVAMNIFPVGDGVQVRLVEISDANVVNGRIRNGKVLFRAVTDSAGQYSMRLPAGTTPNTCRYLVEVGNGSTLTRAFVTAAKPERTDISFESEATVRLLLAQIGEGNTTLCGLNAGDIQLVYGAVVMSPADVFGDSAAAVNASAEVAAAGDPGVQNAIAVAVGAETPVPTGTNTAPPASTATATATVPGPTATGGVATATLTATRPPRTATSTPTNTVGAATRTSTVGFTPTSTVAVPTATDTAAADTPTPTNTVGATATATAPQATATSTSTVAAATATSTATTTVTAVPTNTVAAATATSTALSTFTATAIPTGTATATATAIPTGTATATVTHTLMPSAATATHTATPTNTAVPPATATNTTGPAATATNTIVPGATATNTVAAPATATGTVAPSAPTATHTATPTNTALPPSTATNTVPAAATATNTVPPSTATSTASASATRTVTATATAVPPTATATRTSTPTATAVPATATATRTHTPSPSPTNTALPPCPIAAGRYTLTQVAGGQLQVASIDGGTPGGFPFPAGGVVVQDVSAATQPACVHESVIPASGGFQAPVFCIPGLNFSVQVTQNGCGVGRIDSNGGSDFTVTEIGDTSDSSATCNLPAVGCPPGPPSTMQANRDNSVRVDITVGNGAADTCAGGGTANAIAIIPVQTQTWLPANFTCPDIDGVFNPGVDTDVLFINQNLDFTTDVSTSSWADIDGDGCSIAGAGPPAGFSRTGVCLDIAAQTVTTVATGTIGSDGSPLFDLTFATRLPNTISGPAPSGGATCPSPPIVNFAGSATRCIE